MSERQYLFTVGVSILLGLYFELDALIYFIAGFMMFEAVTDIRLTTTLQKTRHIVLDSGLVIFKSHPRLYLSAERAWRFVVASVLLVVYALLNELGYDMLWFFPWFMGFAIMGAGVSGVCPVLLGLKFIGFR